jgi:signal transduction histidine kinase
MLEDAGASDPAASTLPFLAGGGELGERMRAFDWSSTPLGAPAQWPKSLRTCVRIVLTSSQPMFVWWGKDLTNLYNDPYKAIVGGKHPEALGQPAAQVWREIWREIAPRLSSVLGDNVGTYDEALLLIMERNGYREETYYTFSYSPVPDDDGSTGGVICANTDDTKRIIGERQLATLRDLASRTLDARSSEQAYERAATALALADRDLPFCLLYEIDRYGASAVLRAASGIERAHPAAASQLDLTRAEFALAREAVRSQEIQLIDDLEARFGALPCGAWDTAPARAALVPVPRAGQSGSSGLLLVGLNPYRLLDDDYRGFLSLIARQLAGSIATAEAYQHERQRAEQLAELDRAKTAFFSNVSHEFRTPLTLMLGPLEDALRSEQRALVGSDLDTAYRNALRLLKLVNSLLDFSRIEAGRSRALFVPTELGRLTADLASVFRSAIERAGLTFTVDCVEPAERVYVDHDLWEKIVLNLLSNALKYTFTGSISVKLAQCNGQASLSVTDTGTGIPESELPNLFERFQRVFGARARTHEGSGIGLALTHELVKLHGGSMRVQSQLGAGSTFTVTLPFGSAHLPQDQLGPERESSPSMAGTAPFVREALRWLAPEDQPDDAELQHVDRGRLVLVADDNADMRDYIVRLLRQRWRVVQAADGQQALDLARELRPTLVLTDVMMTNLDGFGLLRELRADPATASIPVIMLSARAGEESRIEGLQAGADDYLVKPFSARELLARVATHLQLATLRSTAEAERQRLYAIFMQAPVAVAVLTGPELRFEVANDPFCELVGRSQLVGLTLREAFSEPGARDALELVEEAFQNARAHRVSEQRVLLERGGTVSEGFFSYVTQPLLDDGGKAVGIIVAATEQTESVLARRRVEGLRRAAENANRARDDFLSTLSHELRTPLNAMVGWSTLLRAGSVPEEKRMRALEAIERNARVQARLVEDMLDLARIEQGKLVLNVGELELVRVVEAAIDAVRPAAEAKQIRLQPVLDSHATIVGDADRLQQVVWNLLSNAIKFTPKGGRVQVRLHKEQSHVEVAVADNGQGIEVQFLPHIFERFRQADPSFTRRAGGLGLGLSIVRSLVELHGGEVSAQSDGPGNGATFVVRLPMAPLRADERPSVPPANPSEPPLPTFACPAALEGLRILVVDDEPETRELMRFLLEQCRAIVATAGSADEALALLAQEPYELLISDIGMPDGDGYSLIRRVRAMSPRQRTMPALALTAFARPEDRTEALRAGFDMHLSKPIDPNELLVVLETLMRNAAQREDA